MLEMLITIAIIGVITVVVVFRYGEFNSSILLRSQGYEIALNLREIQVFSISVRGEESTFRDAYGLYFTTGTPGQYLLFLDANENERYNAGEEVGQPVLLDTRLSVVDLRTGSNCAQEVDDLSITFKRPDFDARIGHSGGTGLAAGCVLLAANNEPAETRTVYVSTTGQIEVE